MTDDPLLALIDARLAELDQDLSYIDNMTNDQLDELIAKLEGRPYERPVRLPFVPEPDLPPASLQVADALVPHYLPQPSEGSPMHQNEEAATHAQPSQTPPGSHLPGTRGRWRWGWNLSR